MTPEKNTSGKRNKIICSMAGILALGLLGGGIAACVHHDAKAAAPATPVHAALTVDCPTALQRWNDAEAARVQAAASAKQALDKIENQTWHKDRKLDQWVTQDNEGKADDAALKNAANAPTPTAPTCTDDKAQSISDQAAATASDAEKTSKLAASAPAQWSAFELAWLKSQRSAELDQAKADLANYQKFLDDNAGKNGDADKLSQAKQAVADLENKLNQQPVDTLDGYVSESNDLADLSAKAAQAESDFAATVSDPTQAPQPAQNTSNNSGSNQAPQTSRNNGSNQGSTQAPVPTNQGSRNTGSNQPPAQNNPAPAPATQAPAAPAPTKCAGWQCNDASHPRPTEPTTCHFDPTVGGTVCTKP